MYLPDSPNDVQRIFLNQQAVRDECRRQRERAHDVRQVARAQRAYAVISRDAWSRYRNRSSRSIVSNERV